MFSTTDLAAPRLTQVDAPSRETAVIKVVAVLALAALALVGGSSLAEARGGRTTAADCAAGSDDPDCPDTADSQAKPPPPPGKNASPAANSGQPRN
jgi:hypothetical protein